MRIDMDTFDPQSPEWLGAESGGEEASPVTQAPLSPSVPATAFPEMPKETEPAKHTQPVLDQFRQSAPEQAPDDEEWLQYLLGSKGRLGPQNTQKKDSNSDTGKEVKAVDIDISHLYTSDKKSVERLDSTPDL